MYSRFLSISCCFLKRPTCWVCWIHERPLGKDLIEVFVPYFTFRMWKAELPEGLRCRQAAHVGRSAAAVKTYRAMCGWEVGWGAAWDMGVSESSGASGSSYKNRNLTSFALFTSETYFPFKKYLLHFSCIPGTRQGAGVCEPDLASVHSKRRAILHFCVASPLPAKPVQEKRRGDQGLETVGESGALWASENPEIPISTLAICSSRGNTPLRSAVLTEIPGSQIDGAVPWLAWPSLRLLASSLLPELIVPQVPWT